MRLAIRWHLIALAAMALVSVTTARADDALYNRLGGRGGIARIVETAYAIILADERVKADFDNINPEHIKPRLVDEICQLSGGPCIYKGRSMAAAHAGLDLTRAKFNAVAEDLQTAMEREGVPYWTQNRLMALLAPFQRDIVTK